MPDNPEYERDLFLRYYGEYLDAKEQNHPLKIWLKAVHCRVELQKLILLLYQAASVQKKGSVNGSVNRSPGYALDSTNH
jgi:hypothetical protein